MFLFTDGQITNETWLRFFPWRSLSCSLSLELPMQFFVGFVVIRIFSIEPKTELHWKPASVGHVTPDMLQADI